MHAAAVRCRIRPMRTEDIPQVMDIERQSFPTIWPQTVYQRELKNNMARYLVVCAPDDGEPEASVDADRGIGKLVRRFFGGLPDTTASRDRVLGMVGLWCMMGQGHIVTIAVRPEYRRQGIGEVLLVAILEAALETGQDEVTLEYRISNLGARAMYEKYGFSQVGVRARYYSDNHEDAVLMTTPPLRSTNFRRLIGQRLSELQRRWGDDSPLAGSVPMLERVAKTDGNGRSAH
jgi:ribosomal-protein-alanine N-acetyltransferase